SCTSLPHHHALPTLYPYTTLFRSVSYLEKLNIWWRRTVQRLLVDRKSEKAAEPLKQLARSSKSPLARLHALWTLDGLGKLDSGLDRKSTRLNSSHQIISYAVFCLK